jgi:hypothetical protein
MDSSKRNTQYAARAFSDIPQIQIGMDLRGQIC